MLLLWLEIIFVPTPRGRSSPTSMHYDIYRKHWIGVLFNFGLIIDNTAVCSWWNGGCDVLIHPHHWILECFDFGPVMFHSRLTHYSDVGWPISWVGYTDAAVESAPNPGIPRRNTRRNGVFGRVRGIFAYTNTSSVLALSLLIRIYKNPLDRGCLRTAVLRKDCLDMFVSLFVVVLHIPG